MSASHPNANTIRAVQACRRQVAGLDDDATWREFLQRSANGQSLRTMSAAQLSRVLDALHQAGAPRKTKNRPRFTDTPQMAMIRGLWLELAQLDGGVADRSEAALGDFVRRQTGQDIGRLNAASASRVIEGLKQWRDRLIAGKE
jgi:phage gp16-like protein